MFSKYNIYTVLSFYCACSNAYTNVLTCTTVQTLAEQLDTVTAPAVSGGSKHRAAENLEVDVEEQIKSFFDIHPDLPRAHFLLYLRYV
jgi:hypothetical protein